MEFYNVVGLVGVLCVLLAYYFLQIGKMTANTISYSFINLIGAAGILYSLFYNWNLSSAVIQCVWLVISIYGIMKSIKNKKKLGEKKS
jgi:hypothetical protein